MIDPDALLRGWLLQDTDGILPLLGNLNGVTAIWCATLPEKYDPRTQEGNGPAIVVRRGGSGLTQGGAGEHELPIIHPRFQITCWAGENESELAGQLDRAVFDWMFQQNNVDLGDLGFILSSVNDTLGQDVKDKETKFATVVSFWTLTLRAFST